MQKESVKTFFGRRKGRALTKTSQKRMRELLPAISIAHPLETFDLETLFTTQREKLWLEVGFGGGEHLAWQAENYPEVNFIGCEPYVNGIAKLLKSIEEKNLNNIKIYGSDARYIMEKMPCACVDRAFLLFSDPWPKYRHRYRRFINNDTLNMFAKILKEGALLRVATDNWVYLHWILQHAPLHPDFLWVDECSKDWAVRKKDWPPTRFEQKALKQGRKSIYLTFQRKTNP